MQKHGGFTAELISFSLIRGIIDTSQRMIIAFLPIFARGLGVTLEEIALIISSRYALGIIAPYLGMYSENHGTKKAMVLGLLLIVIGFASFSIKPIYPMFCIALLLAILGRMLFSPAMQTYISVKVDQSRQGLAMSIPEIGWSGASIIGLPIIGLIIDRYGWTAPFPLLAILVLLAILGLYWLLPPIYHSSRTGPSMVDSIKYILKKSSPILILLGCLLMAISSATIAIIYSVQMESAFDFQVTALGIISFFLGLSEFCGEGLSAVLTDRLRPGIAVCIGIGINMIVAVLMPKIGVTVLGATIGLCFFFLSSEFFMVGILPMIVNMTPEVKITSLSLRITVHQGGVAIGTAIGPWLFRKGWSTNFYAAAVLDLFALFLIFLVTQRVLLSKIMCLLRSREIII